MKLHGKLLNTFRRWYQPDGRANSCFRRARASIAAAKDSLNAFSLFATRMDDRIRNGFSARFHQRTQGVTGRCRQ